MVLVLKFLYSGLSGSSNRNIFYFGRFSVLFCIKRNHRKVASRYLEGTASYSSHCILPVEVRFVFGILIGVVSQRDWNDKST